MDEITRYKVACTNRENYRKLSRIRDQALFLVQFYMDKAKENPEKVVVTKEMVSMAKDLLGMSQIVNDLIEASGLSEKSLFKNRLRLMRQAMTGSGGDARRVSGRYLQLCETKAIIPGDQDDIAELLANLGYEEDAHGYLTKLGNGNWNRNLIE